MTQHQELMLNILNFNHSVKELCVFIIENEIENCGLLTFGDKERIATILEDKEHQYNYFCIEKPEIECVAITMAVSPEFCTKEDSHWSLSFLKRYYTLRLIEHFRKLDFPVKSNFVNDLDVWVKSVSTYPDCDGYRVFNLRVQFNYLDFRPELAIVMGEIRSVFNKPMSDSYYSEIPEDEFNLVLYNKSVLHYNEISDTVKRHLEDVYPCVNATLLRKLNFNRPAPDKSNRYVKFLTEINSFKAKYLDNSAVADIMLLEKEWKTIVPNQLDLSKLKELQFGEGVGTEPKYAVKKYGPKELVADDTYFFFIMHEQDSPLAFTINEYLCGDRSDFKGGLNGFLRIKYNTNSKLSFMFTDKDNPLPEIVEKLEMRTFDTNKKYVAIYLSPHSKETTNVQHKLIYYHVKEALLMKGIASQTIDVNKIWGTKRAIETKDEKPYAILKQEFNYSLPNILVAINAKLGAVPWCFPSQPKKELVIGISAYKSKELDEKYLGSAFSFTNEGKFQGFECFRKSQVQELAGSIALVAKEFCSRNAQLEKLVIHFYKRLSKKELQPVMDALASLNLKFPVVVLSMNKSYSDDIVGFDLSKEHYMPLSGSYIQIGKESYLLFNNQLQTGHETLNSREGYPFPLKINIQQFLPDDSNSIHTPIEEVETLLEQVCQFSQLYWKSVSRQWMPVTLLYPELLAKITPHFKYKDSIDKGRETLWFL